jgi:glycosyltransferase involved in cell wall biosynthesis
MKLSIAVCTHNEGTYVWNLIRYLLECAPANSEIVIVDDYSTDETTVKALEMFGPQENVFVYQHALNGDFATHKNFTNACCAGDWILNLDADELLSEEMTCSLPTYIESNPDIDAYCFPRVNTVSGLTLKHVQKWGWTLSTLPEFHRAKVIDPQSPEYELLEQYGFITKEENGFVYYDEPVINWPDPQIRLFKNHPNIKWEGRVHERVTGYENPMSFPISPRFAIMHHKDITRQERQNDYYDTLS